MRGAAVLATLALFSLLPSVHGQEPIDWQRAVELREKQVRGEALSAPEAAYVRRALHEVDAGVQAPIATRLALAGLTTGDGSGEVFQAPPVQIPLTKAPIELLRATAADGRAIEASYRKPPGAGPFPAVLILHGGLDTQREEKRRWFLLEGPVHTRLLDSGYVVVQGTFRRYDMTNLLAEGPLLDVEALFDAVLSLPFVDPESLSVFGGSGGGSLALDLACRRKPASVAVGEPATILFAGMLKTGEYAPRLAMMGDPHASFLPANRELLQSKLGRFRSPLLVFHGDIHPLKIMNNEIFRPALRAARIAHQWLVYPGEGHGFYFGSATPPETVNRVVADAVAFFQTHSRVKPTASKH